MRIITIDGGGIRGIVPATVINLIETEILHAPISSYCDLFVGTSTGGLLALGLTSCAPISGGGMVSLYKDNAAKIFPQSGTGTSLFKPRSPLGG